VIIPLLYLLKRFHFNAGERLILIRQGREFSHMVVNILKAMPLSGMASLIGLLFRSA